MSNSKRLTVQRTWNKKNIIAASVALLTFIIYLPALRNEFVNWDDGPYVFANFHIRSLDGNFFNWAFWGFHVYNWHPLTWISHALDYALWGLNPLGHHLTSIILHALNTALVTLLAVRLFEIARERTQQSTSAPFWNDRTILIAAGVTGLLFGIHPVHVESVAWVSERKDLLCALFFLLSVLAHIKAVKRTGQSGESKGLTPRSLLPALSFFVLALMSKPMAVSLPLVLLILDWYPLNRMSSPHALKTAVVEKLPFLVFGLISSVLTLLAQRAGGSMELTVEVPLGIRLVIAANALVTYLWKMMLPLDLIPFYPYPQEASISLVAYLVPVVLVLGITITAAAGVKKQNVWLAAWGYYIVTLTPVLGIIQVGEQSMADRYTYLPSLGPFLLGGLMTAFVWAKVIALKRWEVTAKQLSRAGILAAFVALSYGTIMQIDVWKDSFRLWNFVIDKEPEAKRAYYNRGLTFNDRGLSFDKMGLYDRAIADYDRAIADYDRASVLNPPYLETYNNRGLAFDKLGQYERAIADYDKVTALDASYYRAYYNRGMVFNEMGMLEKALTEYTKAIVLNPEYSEAYNNRGAVFYLRHQLGQAIADFNRAIALNPSYYQAYYNRGLAFNKSGQFASAAKDFDEADKLKSLHK